MDRFRSLARKLSEAAAIGLLAAAVLYVPPLYLAERLDAWLFASWSEIAPITGIAVGLLATGAWLAGRRARRTKPELMEASRLADARRAANQGRLAEAWALYRTLPAAPALHPEIYDVACALEAAGSAEEAAELFHRIAQADGAFRDVARRLVRAAKSADDPDDRTVLCAEIPCWEGDERWRAPDAALSKLVADDVSRACQNLALPVRWTQDAGQPIASRRAM